METTQTDLTKEETNELLALLMSNPDVNAKFWAELEAKLRDLYQSNQTLYKLTYPEDADDSGELSEVEWQPARNIDQWLGRFTGQWDATYQPGMGKHWKTWLDEVDSICNKHVRELVATVTDADPDHGEMMEWAMWLIDELGNCEDEILVVAE